VLVKCDNRLETINIIIIIIIIIIIDTFIKRHKCLGYRGAENANK